MEVSENGGTPKSSHFDRIFHEINHPAIGVPPLFILLLENEWFPVARSKGALRSGEVKPAKMENLSKKNGGWNGII
jgi:hypothetical protein